MLEKIAPNFIIYLAVFRLAMIAAGSLAIYLGYRLFVKGVWPAGAPGSDVELKSHNLHFKLRNAAPGSLFALFGVIVIVAMLVGGGPGLTLDMLQNAALAEADSLQMRRIRVEMRGKQGSPTAPAHADQDGLQSALQAAQTAQEAGDRPKALQEYGRAIKKLDLALNQYAWLLHEQGQDEAALPFARVGAAVNPEDADLQDTCAEIYRALGRLELAAQYMGKAAALDARFQEKARQYRQAARKYGAKN